METKLLNRNMGQQHDSGRC